MHLRYTLNILGYLLFFFTSSMLVPIVYSLFHLKEANVGLFLKAIGVGFCLSLFTILLGHKREGKLFRREAVILVSLAWLLGGIIGAIPFYFFGLSDPSYSEFDSFANCFFEAVSGLTTTGASILRNPEWIPKEILLWRALIQWFGGLGIVMLFVALLPMISMGSKRIFQAESTGISQRSDTTNIQDKARLLWIVYVGITFLQVATMKMIDPTLSFYTCFTFAFSTTATAGFSIYSQSAGSMSPAIQWVVVFFMFASGVNYSLYVSLIKRQYSKFINDPELRTYGAILAIAILIIYWDISYFDYHDMNANIADASFETRFRDASFQAVSIQTTTGLSNADFDGWPPLSRLVLFLLMFIGGCGGSTGGGIKVIRVLTALKILMAQLEKSFHPKVIRKVRVGKNTISEEVKNGILAHIVLVILTVLVGTLLLLLIEPPGQLSLEAAFSAACATVNNIGPGFDIIGPTKNYFMFSATSKVLLSGLMILGRLEILTVLALFSQKFWKN